MKKWNWVKKIPWVKVIIGVIAIGVVLFVMDALSKSPTTSTEIVNDKVQSVVVNQVVKKNLVINHEYFGYVEDSTVYIGPDRIQGKIGEVLVSEGEKISQGSILFTLDVSNELVNSELQLKEIELGKNTLDLQIKQLLPDFERLEVLYSEGIIALNELEQIQNQLKAMELQRVQLDQQYDQIINALSVSKNQAEILSPVDGIIEKISIVPGTYIGQQEMIKVIKSDLPTCLIMVAESDIDSFVLYENVQTTIGNTVYEGTIKTIKNRDEQQLLFPVEIEINTTDHLLAGRTAKVTIERYKNQKAMMIPRSSVIAFAGETYVFVLNDNKTVSKKIVQVGESEEQMIEIVYGLSLNSKVIVEGQFSIFEGETVTWISQ